MIRVIFKVEKKNEYGTQEFTYKDYENAEVGDIVVVNTRYGYAIAKVTAVNIYDSRFNENNLASVVQTIYTAADARAEQAKKDAYNVLVAKVKREALLKGLKTIGLDAADYALVENMSTEDLIKFDKAINNI